MPDYKRKLARAGMLLKNTELKWFEELSNSWDGMESDLEDAQTIIKNKIRAGEVLRFLDDYEIDEKTDMVRVKIPAWIIEVQAVFTRKYADESEAHYRFQRTLGVLATRKMIPTEN